MKLHHSLVLFLLIPTICSSAGRNLDSYTWDLTPLFSDQQSWEKERDLILNRMKKITRWKKVSIMDASQLLEMLNEISDLRARAGKLSIYGFLVSDVEPDSAIAQKQYEVGTGLETQVESAVSFLPELILKVDPEKLQQWMKEEPELMKHRFRIHRIQSEAPYTPSTEAKAVLEDASRWPRLSADAFGVLHQTDFGWSDNRSSYLELRRAANSKQRTESMVDFLKSLSRLQDVFALLYTRRVEADYLLAKHRGFRNGMDAIWFLREGLPAGTFRVLVDQTRKRLSLFHRISANRSRAVDPVNPDYPDLFAQLPDSQKNFSIEEVEQIAIQVSRPMGPKYEMRLNEIIKRPWMHLKPLPNKQRAYAIWPPVGGMPPYFIMNYEGTYDDARRYVGGVTLMMSFAGWQSSNPPDTRDDPGIYSNAMIYVGDLLFDDFMLKRARTSPESRNRLLQQWDFLRHHYLQWILCTEFDMKVEELIVKGEIPNGKQLSEMYLKLLREYYGVEVDDVFGAEWMLNSVPFLSYEHQFWPPAVVAAANIVEGLHNDEPSAK